MIHDSTQACAWTRARVASCLSGAASRSPWMPWRPHSACISLRQPARLHYPTLWHPRASDPVSSFTTVGAAPYPSKNVSRPLSTRYRNRQHLCASRNTDRGSGKRYVESSRIYVQHVIVMSSAKLRPVPGALSRRDLRNQSSVSSCAEIQWLVGWARFLGFEVVAQVFPSERTGLVSS